MLKEVRVLSQLSHPAVVRYFNTWLEDIWDPAEALENDSTDTEGSEDDMSPNEFPKHHGGLDFISSNNPVEEDSEPDTGMFNDGDSDDGIVFESSSDGTALGADSEAAESEFDDGFSESGRDHGDRNDAKKLALPDRKHERRSSHRPLKTILYISMEYCDKQVRFESLIISSSS